MKPTIWIFSIEPLDTRYTGEWHSHIPALLKSELGHIFNVVQIDGIQRNNVTSSGAFLNFADTNYWKSSQLCNFLDYYNKGSVFPKDHFLFTDAWNPIITQLKYMKDLLQLEWTIHALWHAGSYDPADFLGRLIGSAEWVRHAEQSFYYAIDHNYFASDFHVDLFCDTFSETDNNEWKNVQLVTGKIVRTGWPMEYLYPLLSEYDRPPKKDRILFPHRIAPEKQLDIFLDLAESMPQYEWVVCQNKNLTKAEYHKLLGESKMVFSANLQETLGIGCYEALCVGAMPLVPARLSYKEMYSQAFTYPSEWTSSVNNYRLHKDKLITRISNMMNMYGSPGMFTDIRGDRNYIGDNFFSAKKLIRTITDGKI